MQEVAWLGDTKEQLTQFPASVSREIGYALFREQEKKPHPAISPLKGFRHTVREIRSHERGDTYRAVYVVNLGDKIYVLHVFQKKSPKGSKTPKPDMEIIRKRLQYLEHTLKAEK